MTDEIDRLKSALADRYSIVREIGSGGMAVVYLAEDLKHKRKVALKVLRPELAAAIGSERFVREIEIAAKLNHPHILPLFDSGSVEEQPTAVRQTGLTAGLVPYSPTTFLYYVMPYVEGESLRERLDREGKIPIAEMVRLTDEISSALSYAHDQGIVHRDVKPENIMLSGGRAVVADFGIARAVTVAGGERLTGTGFAVGTPAYMSPEQAFGDANVDGRSDVYALGCVAYEMVAGRAPFEADTAQALLAKHAVDTAPSMRANDASIPLFVERAVARTLAKNPNDRFQSAREFAEALTSEMVVARVGKRRWTRIAITAPAVVLVLVIAVWTYFTLLGGPAYERLAVLPPVNLMNDPEQEYFVQGMHNALISELQKAGVAVIARTSVMRYRDTEKPIREIAGELRVDAIVEAAVYRTSDSVELEVRLVDGETEEYLADPIIRRGEFGDVVALYRSVTEAIAEGIQAALTPQAEVHLASAGPVVSEAFEAWLKGEFHRGLLSAQDLETALQYYQTALQYDSVFALAHAGIAMVWASRRQLGFVAPSEAGPAARAAIERALELDSTLAEVQHTSAEIKAMLEWDWAGAEEAFERTFEINPNFPEARSTYSHFLIITGRAEDAMWQIERALQLDPFDVQLQMFHGWSLLFLDRYDEAIAIFEKTPNHPMAYIGLRSALIGKGLYEEALAALKVVAIPEVLEALDRGYAEGGFQIAMLRAAEVQTARSRTTYVQPTWIAALYALGGEPDQAFEWLERGLQAREPNMPYINAFSELDSLHDDPRWRDLLRRMGLPER